MSDEGYLRVEANDCPMSFCAAPAGSPCRTGKGRVAVQYHTARFRLVPSLAKALDVPTSPRGSFRAVKQVLADASDAVEWLPLTVEVAERYEDVPYPDMKDPFDRIIVAAAWAAAVPLVTADRAISTSGSPVQVIW